MNNAISIYDGVEGRLSLPAGRVEVFVDGKLCPELEVGRLVKSGMGEYGRAELVVHGSWDFLSKRSGDFGCGREVAIERVFGDAESLPMFSGQIESCRKVLSSKGSRMELLVCDYSSKLGRVTVYGRYLRAADGGTRFIDSMDTVFNEGGSADCEAGDGEAVFAQSGQAARYWSCADAICYLLRHYVPAGELEVPFDRWIESIAGMVEVRDFDVTGLSVLEALERCCEMCGVRFRFEPVGGDAGAGQAIVFYRYGKGRRIELNMQQVGERFSVSETKAWQLDKSSAMPVTNRYIGRGDYKVFESTFELVGAWDKGLEQARYGLYSPTTNKEFHAVRDVWRKWCLNEAGDYSDEPYDCGPAFDFSEIFGTTNYVRRRRRFWPALSSDSQGKSAGYYLERSLDGGLTWSQYGNAFDNLHGECGIWLSSESLDIETWVAAIKGMLRFRITASVVSDERLSFSAADGPVGSCVPVVDRIVNVPRLYRYGKVASGSVFAGSGAGGGIDESERLKKFVRQQVAKGRVVFRAQVRTVLPGVGYECGDIVECGPESRDLFGTKHIGESVFNIVDKVEIDFVGQCTVLDIVGREFY